MRLALDVLADAVDGAQGARVRALTELLGLGAERGEPAERDDGDERQCDREHAEGDRETRAVGEVWKFCKSRVAFRDKRGTGPGCRTPRTDLKTERHRSAV